MRKRRVILFDDDRFVLEMLKDLFEMRGYEVIASLVPVLCPVYDGQKGCDTLPPCGDILITDYNMPGMSGLDLIREQGQRGCRMPIQNKAIISGDLAPHVLSAVAATGCDRFHKPFAFGELEKWIAECELRMDLSQPLKVKRKEQRQVCSSDVRVQVDQNSSYRAHLINQSDSGLCVRVAHPVAVEQILNVHADPPLLSGQLTVRWMRPADGGEYLAGMSRG
jgi:DNA-binding response OmpR family regulator